MSSGMPAIQVRAALPIALVFALLAAIEVLYFPGRTETAHVRELRAKAVAVSELTAHGAAPGLEFDDLSSVKEQLEGAARDPELEYVAVLTSSGAVYASIDKVGVDVAKLPHVADHTTDAVVGGHLHVVTPVSVSAGSPGVLVAGFSTENVVLQTAESRRAASLIGLAILAVGLVVSAWNGRAVQRVENLLEENRAARRVAEAASRAKSEFLANMSHELRTPMNGVLGMASLLAGTELSARQTRFVEAIRRSGQSLLSIISDILDFSKIESGKLELDVTAFDVGSLVEDVGESLSVQAQEKGLELICRVAPDVPSALRGDPLRLQQVLMNLVGNAIKFTTRGEVSVHVTVESSTDRDTSLRFRVTDTGVGIAKEKLGELFTAFMQADTSTTRVYGGTGLGLAISKRLVELMRGVIGVDSQPGVGSTFWFVVPFGKVGAVSAADQRARLRGARALVVDDNATNREFLVEVLHSWGIHADQADGADAALARIEEALEHRLPYDLLLLDMHMPHRDGMDLARAIVKDARVEAPMVLLTSAIDHDGDALREAGIRAWLPKPLRQSSLLETLTSVLSVGQEACPEDNPGDAGRAEQALPARLEGVRVLAAEDNEANQQVLAGVAEYFGFHVTIVGNGRDALDAVQRNGDFDVVLMDCQMPVMDGYRATHAIREWEGRLGRPRVPIIAVTAHALAGERDKVLDAGMDDYITKPIDFRALARKIAELGARGAPPAGPASAAPGPRGVGEPTRQSAPATGVLDLAVVEQLRELASPARPTFFVDLVEKFSADARGTVGRLEDAIRRGDARAVRELAHFLKGGSRSLGAARVGALSEELELLGKTGHTAGARELLSRIEPELAAALAELRAGSANPLPSNPPP
ncbi:MAG TPA: response regulator [Polyangiaceae bacterium]|nr:response regulator [Polyangiaceae bacterium]